MVSSNQNSKSGSRETSEAGLFQFPQPRHHQSKVSRLISGIDERDFNTRYKLEKVDTVCQNSPNSSFESINARRKIISWDEGDPANPYNWSPAWKAFIVFIGMLVVVNSTMGSSLPSNAVPVISEYFNITSSFAKVLPISTYLIGYILGPLLFGPLSETYGRRFIMSSSFIVFTLLTMACALAPTWESFLFFRFLTGVSASSPFAVIGGVYADIYSDPVTRGRAMAIFIGGTCVGPLIAPAISGYVSPDLGWRWVFWIGLIIAGASLPFLIFLPETYGPILLAKRAARLRKSIGDEDIVAPIELEKRGWKQMATITLTRPIRMIMYELIVLATCLYLSLAYGIFYMYFIAYPVVFQGIYGQSLGFSGLMFLPIGLGAIIAIFIFLWYDAYLHKAQLLNKPWTAKEESRRLPLACIGGPLYVIALLWLGWTARPGISYLVPMFAGVPFGMGFILIFIALLNYLADAYQIFAASSMAAASCCRSLAGVALPFAATPMYNKLGVAWATSVLAFLSLGMCVVPFLFLWKGDRIRAGSKFCIYLKEMKEEQEKDDRARHEERGRRNDGERQCEIFVD